MAGISGGIALASGIAGAVGGAGGGGGGGGMPRWQRKAMKANYGVAQDVAAGMSVEPFNADQNAAFAGVRDSQGYLDGDMRHAQNRADRLAQGVTPGDIRSFYNPFENDVVGAYLKDVNTMHGQEDLRVNDAAEASKAFGGDREAVYRAVSQGVIDDNGQRNLAGIRSRGYELASGNAMQNHGLKLAGNDQLQRLIESRQGSKRQDLDALLRSGYMQQEQGQFARDLPQRRLGVLQQGVGSPIYQPPSPQPVDPIAGALAGFQGGYGTGADIGGLLSRAMSSRAPGIGGNYGPISVKGPSQFPMPFVPQISPYPGVNTYPYNG